MKRSVIVYTWHDYCDWLRASGTILTTVDEFDPGVICNHKAGLQAWHKTLIEKHCPDYVIHFLDSNGGIIVFGLRKYFLKTCNPRNNN